MGNVILYYGQLKTATEKIKYSASSSDKTFHGFNTKLVNQVNSVKGISTTVDSFLNNVTGLVNSLNCNFVGTDLSNLIEGFCVVMLPYLYSAIYFFGLGMYMLLIENLFVYILAYKFSRYNSKNLKNVNDKKINPNGNQIQTNGNY